MCGIAGVVHADRTRPVDRDKLAAMTHELRYRGPDAQTFHVEPGVGLGHRRLSIIDLVSGDQPMTDPTGQVTVTYNGEVYNFLELRGELSAVGVTFRTTSDTEVLLLGYLTWGIDGLVSRLAGMFAFGLWDARDETLLLVRDRLGVKPLYWAELPDGGLVFGSELSAVVASGEVRPTLNLSAVAQYLTGGYGQGEESMLCGVRRLPPATVLSWRRGGTPGIRCYWDLAGVWSGRERDRRELPVIREEFGSLLRHAVRQRLISDVPLGAFLSGGLDSSTISALMMQEAGRVETFSIGFEDASYNELPWARRVASALGTTHFDEVVRGQDPELLLEISSKQDEPLADTSIIPTYVLSRMARHRVTVALSGDGGDELLAGYFTHQADAIHARARRLPRWLVGGLRRAVGALPDSRRKVNAVFKAKQFLAGIDLDASDAHASWRMLLDAEAVRALLLDSGRLPDVSPFGLFRRAYEEVPELGTLDRFLYVDYRTWLLDDILVKADRASMAHGLEVRSPFLDHRLVEFCASLPAALKRRGARGKVLLQELARGLVPDAVIRRRKAGFNAPVSRWLAGPWRHLALATLDERALKEIAVLDPQVVGGLLDEHLANRRDHGHRLFIILMLVLWLRRVRPMLP
jgi:asparagine synthase (glutamine-hydrolysing)